MKVENYDRADCFIASRILFDMCDTMGLPDDIEKDLQKIIARLNFAIGEGFVVRVDNYSLEENDIIDGYECRIENFNAD
ncbi:hypothetical protein [Ruminococcus albus]|uniref:Uncharacterized protein n=1 Tax=Ruminococcus albus TaxID=1264 RepID=A0A1I1RNT9_RUMAL|nr:hypothetical protein [Ruminococcus albus]SFD36011.1 hypothetical protein SAMN02910406_03742 [Ruminococcus albus]